MYNFTLPSTFVLEGVGDQRFASSALHQKNLGTHCKYNVELEKKRWVQFSDTGKKLTC
jgi:hypothetical protein